MSVKISYVLKTGAADLELTREQLLELYNLAGELLGYDVKTSLWIATVKLRKHTATRIRAKEETARLAHQNQYLWLAEVVAKLAGQDGAIKRTISIVVTNV
jgi:hypothetical protein